MDVELVVQTRTGKGKGFARALRRENEVPAVLYGPGVQPVNLTVPAKNLEKLLRAMGEESKLLTLKVDDGATQETRQAIIREVQVHPFRRRFLHVDFYEVPLDKPIIVNVPVELGADCIGVKKGGSINLIRRTLSVRCLPGEIPEKVHIDISTLDLGGTIYVEDLAGASALHFMEQRRVAVVTIVGPEGKKEAAEGGEEGKSK